MKLSQDLDKLINTYHQLLQQCHDALDPTAPQRKRNELRDALGAFLKAQAQGGKDGTAHD